MLTVNVSKRSINSFTLARKSFLNNAFSKNVRVFPAFVESMTISEPSLPRI
jgi:hypothetical protein